METDTTTAGGTWSNGFCGCCGVKSCGCVPCCCPNFCCPCMPMMWASAMSQIKGKEYSYPLCCIGAQCCPVCTFAYAYMELKAHYKINDSCAPCPKCCFPVLSLYQMFNEILVKEGLHMVNVNVVPDGPVSYVGAPPEAEEMER